jgi:AcrR family transcriptional regulator
MLAAVNNEGYTDTTVASVIARCGVSRRTFYRYFTDKDDCFLALYRDLSRRLLDQVARAVSESPPERALEAVVDQVTKHAEAEPAQAQFLASDALAGGARALREREQTIREISSAIRTAQTRIAPRIRSPDLPPGAVIGATHSLIAQRLRRGERNLAQLSQDLAVWLRHYEQPIGNHRWSTACSGPLRNAYADRSEPGEQMSPLAPSRTTRERPGKLSQNQRSRILAAAAESAERAGYAGTTVAAISARARINNRFFYRHFRDKRQAFLALHELAYEQSIAVGAAAYFRVDQWPERVWRCLLATSQFHAARPALAHVACVETHALGLPAIQRVEDGRYAFATLLRADSPNAGPVLDMTAAEAISAAVFELAHDQVRRQRAKDLPRYAYRAVYLVLAPFLGVQAANRFVQRKLKDAERRSAPTKSGRRS